MKRDGNSGNSGNSGNTSGTAWQALPLPPSLLGESPFWHPEQAALYWCDIAGKQLNRFTPGAAPATGQHTQWPFDSEPASCAPLPGGDVLVALRRGLVRLDPGTGKSKLLVKPPYDPAEQRFNDGKADPQGRYWASTLFEPRTAPKAALYRWSDIDGRIQRMAGDITVGNGLAFSPDGATLYCSDTTAHRIDAFAFDGANGTLSDRRTLVQFPLKQDATQLDSYAGRPDGAAVDVEGAYWVAMFEGQRLLRIAPDGAVLQELVLPVRCPTMPCFGGPDLCTLYVTTSRDKRPADELAAQPLAGCVLHTRVSVPGLPVNFARA